MEQVGALEATAMAIKADNDGAETADENCGPVHPELFSHHLPARCAITVKKVLGCLNTVSGGLCILQYYRTSMLCFSFLVFVCVLLSIMHFVSLCGCVFNVSYVVLSSLHFGS